MKRFFGRKEGKFIIIEGSELNHLHNVLRMHVDDCIIASVNDDYDYQCRIIDMNKTKVVAEIEKAERCPALPKKEIVLFQAMPKREYFETIVTKGVELGVSEIIPFISNFSVNRDLKQERINQIVRTACKQCERSKTINVSDIISFDSMLKQIAKFDVIMFANEHETQPFKPAVLDNVQKIAVVVGCEAGFTMEEVEKILKTGAISVSLGTRILRCDTASVAMLALVDMVSNN